MRLIVLVLFLAFAGPCFAHPAETRTESRQAVVVQLRFGAEEVARASEYQVFRPGASEAFQTGRTDELGRVAFVPDQAGPWTVSAQARSGHGLHAVSVEVEVDENGGIKASSRPPLTRSGDQLGALGLLFALLGLFSYFRSGRSRD